MKRRPTLQCAPAVESGLFTPEIFLQKLNFYGAFRKKLSNAKEALRNYMGGRGHDEQKRYGVCPVCLCPDNHESAPLQYEARATRTALPVHIDNARLQ